MKIVIIGGGIAGLSFALLMQKKGHEVIICERYATMPEFGNAFMVHPIGISSLAGICGLDPSGANFPGRDVHSFQLLTPNNEVIRSEKQLKWRCMSRCELANFLTKFLQPGTIKFSHSFSHFEFDGNRATTAVFEDGQKITGDIFIGSDGGNSKVRKNIFGDTAYSNVEVQEILGIAKESDVSAKFNGVFTKYQSKKHGLSFGFIPFSKTDLIWFTQFDVSMQDIYHFGEGRITDFLHRMLIKFPPVVKQLINSSPPEQLYLWRTRDFNPLPRFHSHNIVLIGDAAHLALPFTSAGTTNAIRDAIELASSMEETPIPQDAFKLFHQKRIPVISEHISFGRKLKDAFLRPDLHINSNIELPFIQ